MANKFTDNKGISRLWYKGKKEEEEKKKPRTAAAQRKANRKSATEKRKTERGKRIAAKSWKNTVDEFVTTTNRRGRKVKVRNPNYKKPETSNPNYGKDGEHEKWNKKEAEAAKKRPGPMTKNPDKAFFSPALGRYVTASQIKAQAAEDRKQMLANQDKEKKHKELEKGLQKDTPDTSKGKKEPTWEGKDSGRPRPGSAGARIQEKLKKGGWTQAELDAKTRRAKELREAKKNKSKRKISSSVPVNKKKGTRKPDDD